MTKVLLRIAWLKNNCLSFKRMAFSYDLRMNLIVRELCKNSFCKAL